MQLTNIANWYFAPLCSYPTSHTFDSKDENLIFECKSYLMQGIRTQVLRITLKNGQTYFSRGRQTKGLVKKLIQKLSAAQKKLKWNKKKKTFFFPFLHSRLKSSSAAASLSFFCFNLNIRQKHLLQTRFSPSSSSSVIEFELAANAVDRWHAL